MTYNFDTDRWYDNHLAVLETRHKQGELDQAQLVAAVEKLDRDYDEMLERLDGTYRLPD